MQQHCREPPSSLQYLAFPQSPIETRLPYGRCRTGGWQLCHSQGSIFHSMCNDLIMPCTRYGSGTRVNSTPCAYLMLVATILLLQRQTRILLPCSSTSQIRVQKWGLQLSPHHQVHDRGSGGVQWQTYKHQAALPAPLLVFSLWAFYSDIIDQYFRNWSHVSM